MTTKVAIIGSGNIGTDLTVKVGRSPTLEVAALVGIDPTSDGLARAAAAGIPTTADGVEGLIAMPGFEDVAIVMDATSARAHVANAQALAPYGKRMIDLTPAALGPFVIPPVNLGQHLDAPDVNMVTCGGQATVPIVAAVASVAPVRYAEIVASIASRSAGPGTRANIDEFTETTARAVEVVGGAERGKAIIVLNPAKPALLMRDTVLCVVDAEGEHAADPDAVLAAVQEMVERVQVYVPGYRLKQAVQLRTLPAGESLRTLLGADAPARDRLLVSVFLEVEGRGDYLPPFAGNLDIMTAAAVEVAEQVAARQPVAVGGAA